MLDKFLSHYENVEQDLRKLYEYIPEEHRVDFISSVENLRTLNNELNNRYNVDGKGTYIRPTSIKDFCKAVKEIKPDMSSVIDYKYNHGSNEEAFIFQDHWLYIKNLSEYLQSSSDSKEANKK